MEGLEWESIQKSYKKRIVVLLTIGIPILILSGIFFYNNRDFFSVNTVEEAVLDQADLSNISQTIDTLIVETEDSVTNLVAAKDSESYSDKFLGISPEITKIHEELYKPPSRSSVILSGIECWTFDRKDLRLLMSLELYSLDRKQNKDVVLIPNDLKVVVQQLVRGKELSLIKKETLKSEILRSVNDMLGVDFFIDLEYVDFKIEKVLVP